MDGGSSSSKPESHVIHHGSDDVGPDPNEKSHVDVARRMVKKLSMAIGKSSATTPHRKLTPSQTPHQYEDRRIRLLNYSLPSQTPHQKPTPPESEYVEESGDDAKKKGQIRLLPLVKVSRPFTPSQTPQQEPNPPEYGDDAKKKRPISHGKASQAFSPSQTPQQEPTSPEYLEVSGDDVAKEKSALQTTSAAQESYGVSMTRKLPIPSLTRHPIPTLAKNLDDDWRYCKYIVDKEGYAINDSHFSEEEVSEDSDDEAKKKSALRTTKKSRVASMTKKLIPMKIGKSSNTLKKCIHLPLHLPAEGVFLLTFDGYHRNKNSNGGYGAMLRYGDGTPLAAVAGGSKQSVSAYYHILEGLQSGVNLALQFQNIRFIYFVCNSQRVCETVRGCFFKNAAGACRYHASHDAWNVVCIPCLRQNLNRDEPIEIVTPIIKDIVVKGQRYYRLERPVKAHQKEWNKPADYLAKLVRSPGEEKKFGQGEFPEALSTLINEHGGRIPFMIN